jgi:hypothetical protein
MTDRLLRCDESHAETLELIRQAGVVVGQMLDTRQEVTDETITYFGKESLLELSRLFEGLRKTYFASSGEPLNWLAAS